MLRNGLQVGYGAGSGLASQRKSVSSRRRRSRPGEYPKRLPLEALVNSELWWNGFMNCGNPGLQGSVIRQDHSGPEAQFSVERLCSTGKPHRPQWVSNADALATGCVIRWSPKTQWKIEIRNWKVTKAFHEQCRILHRIHNSFIELHFNSVQVDLGRT